MLACVLVSGFLALWPSSRITAPIYLCSRVRHTFHLTSFPFSSLNTERSLKVSYEESMILACLRLDLSPLSKGCFIGGVKSEVLGSFRRCVFVMILAWCTASSSLSAYMTHKSKPGQCSLISLAHCLTNVAGTSSSDGRGTSVLLNFAWKASQSSTSFVFPRPVASRTTAPHVWRVGGSTANAASTSAFCWWSFGSGSYQKDF